MWGFRRPGDYGFRNEHRVYVCMNFLSCGSQTSGRLVLKASATLMNRSGMREAHLSASECMPILLIIAHVFAYVCFSYVKIVGRMGKFGFSDGFDSSGLVL